MKIGFESEPRSGTIPGRLAERGAREGQMGNVGFNVIVVPAGYSLVFGYRGAKVSAAPLAVVAKLDG
jgi:hypothetical protein